MKPKHSTKQASRSGWVMLALVAAGYVFAFFFDAYAAGEAVDESLHTLATVAPIMLVVLLLTTLMGTFVDPKAFTKHLGKDSGAKGWVIALIAGIVSHGSSYVWYPLLADLRAHGTRNGLIITFLYARAVKIPWLPLMAGYFGLAFTIVLTLYIVAGAYVQGRIAQALLHDD